MLASDLRSPNAPSRVPAARVEWARGACRRATEQRRHAPLVRASQSFSEPKRAYFDAAYLSMRLIDDAVDDCAGLDDAAALNAARAELDARLAAIEAALSGDPPEGDDLFAATLLGLCLDGPTIGVGPEPWRDLACALRDDLARAPIRDWRDFDRYSDGASLAPTALFLTILAAGDALEPPQAGYLELREIARPLAAHCYLGHIARDLEKDAAIGGRALTLPDRAFVEAGVDPAALARAAASGETAPFARLRAVIRAEVAGRRAAVDASLARLSEVTPPRALTIARAMADHYGALAD